MAVPDAKAVDSVRRYCERKQYFRSGQENFVVYEAMRVTSAMHTIDTRNGSVPRFAGSPFYGRRLSLCGQPEQQPSATMTPAIGVAVTTRRRLTRNLMVNVILIVVGCAAVAAGILGIVIPGLPTTPFLLLASWCFARSSRTMYRTLHQAPFLGTALTRWQQHKAVTHSVKVVAVAMMSFTILLAAASHALPVVAKCAIGVVVMVVMLTVLRLPTFNKCEPPCDSPVRFSHSVAAALCRRRQPTVLVAREAKPRMGR